MQHIFIVKAYLPEVDSYVYMPDYADSTAHEVEMKVWQKAQKEGYTGTIEDRLKALKAEIVRVQLIEEPSDGAKSKVRQALTIK